MKARKLGLILVLAWLVVAMVLPLIMLAKAEVQSVKLYPIEDAHVESNNADSNYARSTKAKVGYYNSGMRRYYYLKFRLSDIGISGDQIINATLYVYSIGKSSGNVMQLFALKNVTNNWSEDSITWNNKPDPADTIASNFGFPNGGWKSIDVTSWAKNCQGECSLVFTYDSSNVCEYEIASREYGDVDKRPYLLIYYQPEVITETITAYVTTETETVNTTITETVTETITQTDTVTTTVTDYVTETMTTTVTQTDTIYTTETVYTTETSTVTQTITDVITETATTTITETHTEWANETVTVTTTITPTTTITETVEGNATLVEQSVDYQALADMLMPIVLIVGVLGTLLSLLLQSTSFRRGD